jgi:hypothetical protein
MSFLDFILNVAGLLLWLSWRSARLDPLLRATPATLAGTIRRTAPSRLKRWDLLVYLALLVSIRAYLYRALAPSLSWTPQLDLGVVVLAFRNNNGWHLLLFSVLSLLRVIVVFYFWLLFLTCFNRRNASSDPLQKLITLHLGKVANWPGWIQLALPAVLGGLLWLAFHPAMIRCEVVNPASSNLHLAGQCVAVGASVLLSLKYLLPIFFTLHLITTYVYLGTNPLWDFAGSSSRNILNAVGLGSIRARKIDFGPIVALGICGILLLYPGPQLWQFAISAIETRFRVQITIWPG